MPDYIPCGAKKIECIIISEGAASPACPACPVAPEDGTGVKFL